MSEEPATTKRCPWCAEEIQAQAIRCKHCAGDVSPRKPAVRPWVTLLGLAFFVGLPAVGLCTYVVEAATTTSKAPPEKSFTEKAEDERTMAWVMAKEFVTRGLKSPGTANFGEVFKGTYQSPSDHVRSLGPGRYEAQGWVDSQNGFGALVRTKFRVTMRRDGDGTWAAVEGPSFDEP